MSESNAGRNGLGCGTVLFLIFLVLKLTEVGVVATWSWWWVTAPLWIPWVLFCVIALLLVGVNALD